MPSYDYKCESCHTEQEILHGMCEVGKPRECACGGNLKRIYKSFPAVHGADSGLTPKDPDITTNDSDVGEILDNTVDDLT